MNDLRTAPPRSVGNNKGQIGIYDCTQALCRHRVVTVHADAGTAPFHTPCPKCGGMMQAHPRLVEPGPSPKPEYEWYWPNWTELEAMKPSMRDYCMQGGLLCRPIQPPAEE